MSWDISGVQPFRSRFLFQLVDLNIVSCRLMLASRNFRATDNYGGGDVLDVIIWGMEEFDLMRKAEDILK